MTCKAIERIENYAAAELLKEFKGKRVRASTGTARLAPKGPYEIVGFDVYIRESDDYDEHGYPCISYIGFTVIATMQSIKTGKRKIADFDLSDYVELEL